MMRSVVAKKRRAANKDVENSVTLLLDEVQSYRHRINVKHKSVSLNTKEKSNCGVRTIAGVIK